MLRQLWKTLLHETWSTALSTLCVAVAIALVLVFEGFRLGLYDQIRAFPAELPADLVATQSGVSSVLAARSVLPRSARGEIEAVPGVKVAHPLGGVPVIYSRGSRSTPIYVVAYDTAGGPRRLSAGRGIAETGEVVVDASLAARYDLAPGDVVEFLGYGFRVVGLSAAPSNGFNPYVYVRLVDLIDLYMAGDLPGDLPLDAALSFLLIEVEPGRDVDTVRREIERRVASVDVFTPAELAENDVRVVRGFMGPALNLLVGVAYVAGILIVGLTLYASVVGRLRAFGIMKALGARPRLLGLHVIGEALVVSAVAFGLGMVLALGITTVLHALAPQYLVEPLATAVLARTVVSTLCMAVAGALLPMSYVAAVDAAVVFRE